MSNFKSIHKLCKDWFRQNSKIRLHWTKCVSFFFFNVLNFYYFFIFYFIMYNLNMIWLWGEEKLYVAQPVSTHGFTTLPKLNSRTSLFPCLKLSLVPLSTGIHYSSIIIISTFINWKSKRYRNTAFFPINGKGWKDSYNGRNYAFCLESHAYFGYSGGEVFGFEGDDDVFVYINDLLVIDLGGVHPAQSASVKLDEIPGLLIGNNYRFDFFYCERHTVDSRMYSLPPLSYSLQTFISFNQNWKLRLPWSLNVLTMMPVVFATEMEWVAVAREYLPTNYHLILQSYFVWLIITALMMETCVPSRHAQHQDAILHQSNVRPNHARTLHAEPLMENAFTPTKFAPVSFNNNQMIIHSFFDSIHTLIPAKPTPVTWKQAFARQPQCVMMERLALLIPAEMECVISLPLAMMVFLALMMLAVLTGVFSSPSNGML